MTERNRAMRSFCGATTRGKGHAQEFAERVARDRTCTSLNACNHVSRVKARKVFGIHGVISMKSIPALSEALERVIFVRGTTSQAVIVTRKPEVRPSSLHFAYTTLACSPISDGGLPVTAAFAMENICTNFALLHVPVLGVFDQDFNQCEVGVVDSRRKPRLRHFRPEFPLGPIVATQLRQPEMET